MLNYYFVLFILPRSIVSIPSYPQNVPSDPSISRIANGENGKIEDLPYVVRLHNKHVLCSGAIINEEWVLTAAHCILRGKIYEVQAGFDDINANDIQKRLQLKVIKHESHSEGLGQHDVALIKVEPFVFSNKVAAVPLSDEVWPQGKQMYNVPCVAAGWGNDDIRGSLPNHLQKLNVVGRHGEDGCACVMPYLNKRLVCLGGKTGRGPCSGDSGSVLVCNKKAVGISHVIYLEDMCDPYRLRFQNFSCKQTLASYIYICPVLDWIRKYVPGIPSTPASCRGCKISVHQVEITILSILLKFHASKL